MNRALTKLTWPAWYWLTAACFLAFLVVIWRMLAEGPQSFDLDCAEYFKTHAQSHTGMRNVLWAITQLGSPLMLGSLAGVAVSTLVLLKKRLFALVWLFAVVGGALLNYGMKGEFDRSRPPPSLRDPAVANLTSLSFPSGHSMGSTIGLGLCVYLVIRRVNRGSLRAVGIASLVLLIGLICFSRIYLRAHWFTDVVGGIAVGAAWLIFCLGIYEWRRGTLPVPEEETEPEDV